MTDQTETPDLAELRRLLDDVRALATREGIYNGNRAVLDIIGRVEPLLDAAAERVALGRRGDTLARDLGAAVVRADRAESERDALAAKVERVRALHIGEHVEDEGRNRCFECGDDWPCPTIRTMLDATPETGGES